MRRWLVIATAVPLMILGPTAAGQGLVHRASLGLAGGDADCLSVEPGLSSDGRFVAFQSYASNLVPDDTNGCSDVFLHDCVTGTTVRVSVSSSGAQGDFYSGEPAISADGRYIAFRSDATNLVPGDTNEASDVFVHERATGRTYRVSMGPAGVQPNGPSGRPSISKDGRHVAFESEASNLVADDKNGVRDVFVRDRGALTTTRVSTGHAGEGDAESKAPSISGDGRAVAFVSRARNFASENDLDDDVFLFDLRARRLTLISADPQRAAGGGESPVISENGSVVVFESCARLRPTDLNADRDVYYYRVHVGLLDVASISSAGTPGRRWNVTPEFGPETTIRAHSAGGSVSRDGRFVAFVSLARDLAPGEIGGSEVYVRDLESGKTRRVAADVAGSSPGCAPDPVLGVVDCPPVRAQIAGNGLSVGIQTRGSFVPADANGQDDIYVVDLAESGRSAQVRADRKPE